MFLKFVVAVVVSSLIACAPSESPPPRVEKTVGIVHGQKVSPKDELGKSVVALVIQGAQGEALCTGSILSEDTVLTAAHCVDDHPKKITIVFGPVIRSSKNFRSGVSYVQHPRWKKQTASGRGDLALILFSGGLPSGYTPVHLLEKSTKISKGLEVWMMGYGVASGVKHSGDGVLRFMGTQVEGWESSTEVITDGQKSSVCFGDSGGPSFLVEGGATVQWGVASSVLNSTCNEASIHTSLQTYLRWLGSAAAHLRQRQAK